METERVAIEGMHCLFKILCGDITISVNIKLSFSFTAFWAIDNSLVGCFCFIFDSNRWCEDLNSLCGNRSQINSTNRIDTHRNGLGCLRIVLERIGPVFIIFGTAHSKKSQTNCI